MAPCGPGGSGVRCRACAGRVRPRHPRGARMAITTSRGLLGLGLAALLASAAPAAAKTLVYCSEGSPENFTPALNTTGTTFDAARPVYDQLVEFEPGSTNVTPGL